ncbi:hypothetical protein LX32DRAFT_730626 [Colletotrichum zoysiae]|uniref:Uncharacterized protein n=1 Tax=Colletotrichum zoysiae TaxID=1216348 RepID=A0AAD9HB79_9PEZI|nr:hypothetical protein LX32DRAFT_730626 [Colletotrichum zoysiae]
MSSATATETQAEAAPVKLALACGDKIHSQYEYSQCLPAYDEETSLPPLQHISHGQDFQVRVKWEERTVALWDKRVTAPTAISDYNVHNPQEGLRHGFRITTLADKPTGVNGLESTW